MIVTAALPLVAAYGAAVTTAQTARAAGIGESTVFRAFKDKDEVLDACAAEAADSDHVLREPASVSPDEPLAERLLQAAEALHAHLEHEGSPLLAEFAHGLRGAAVEPLGERGGDVLGAAGQGRGRHCGCRHGSDGRRRTRGSPNGKRCWRSGGPGASGRPSGPGHGPEPGLSPTATDVARRGADGYWRYVIDSPFGAAPVSS